MKEFSNDSIDPICVEVKTGNEKLLIGCIYRPPKTGKEQNEKINETITKASVLVKEGKYSSLLITGDFNHSSIDWSNEDCPIVNGSDHYQAETFISALEDNFLAQMVREKTFQKTDGVETSILDLIIIDDQLRVEKLTHNPPIGYKNQGHQVLKWEFILKEEKPTEVITNEKKYALRRGKYDEDMNGFLSEIDWKTLFVNKKMDQRY